MTTITIDCEWCDKKDVEGFDIGPPTDEPKPVLICKDCFARMVSNTLYEALDVHKTSLELFR